MAKDYLELAEVTADLQMRNDAELVVTGSMGATVEILGQPIRIIASRAQATTSWRFVLDLPRPRHIPGLDELATWALPEQFATKLPSSVMPFGRGLDLTAMQVSLNATTGKLEQVTFDIQNSAPWVIIEKYLILDTARVTGKVTDFASDQKLDLPISARLVVDRAVILFSADHRPSKPWVLKASLEKPVTFDFTKLLAKMALDNEYHLPADLSLPTLTINSMTGEATPAENRFKFTGDITLTSNLKVLELGFKMANFKAKVEIENTAKKYVELACSLEFETLKVATAVAFGSADAHTIFRGALLSDITVESLANVLVPNSFASVAPTDTTTTSENAKY